MQLPDARADHDVERDAEGHALSKLLGMDAVHAAEATQNKRRDPDLMPKRVQIQTWRKPGGRKPDNVVIVARPSRWGNPISVDPMGGLDDRVAETRSAAVTAFRDILGDESLIADYGYPMDDIEELRGKDLACYCPLDEPCHADVLLEMANQDPDEEPK